MQNSSSAPLFHCQLFSLQHTVKGFGFSSRYLTWSLYDWGYCNYFPYNLDLNGLSWIEDDKGRGNDKFYYNTGGVINYLWSLNFEGAPRASFQPTGTACALHWATQASDFFLTGRITSKVTWWTWMLVLYVVICLNGSLFPHCNQ